MSKRRTLEQGHPLSLIIQTGRGLDRTRPSSRSDPWRASTTNRILCNRLLLINHDIGMLLSDTLLDFVFHVHEIPTGNQAQLH